MLTDNQLTSDATIIGSRIGRIDPDNFRNQSSPAADDDNEVEFDGKELDDEPVDEDGDPTGANDHHQDDNYALGGHVTRSGSV